FYTQIVYNSIFQKVEFNKMIITKLYVNNWYSFVDCELDLTYSRKINDSTISYEYLPSFENIRYKRVVILTGANASGKTSLAKIILAIRAFLNKKNLNSFFKEGMHPDKNELDFTIEFIDKKPTSDPRMMDNNYYSHIHQLKTKVIFLKDDERVGFHFTYKAIEIKKSDNIIKLRELLEKLDSNTILKGRDTHYISNYENEYSSNEFKDALFKFSNLDHSSGWSFLYNDLSDDYKLKFRESYNKEILSAVLKTFDPSITSINEAIEKGENETNGFFINFHNKDKIYISNDGKIATDKRHLLSLGTYEATKIASFISSITKTKGVNGCTFFLDEGMSHVQSEIERAIIALIIEKMNIYSQFFYTTHNYDILDMNLPIHSYLFIKRDSNHNSVFIKAEDHFNKNDRSIINYVKNDVLCTLPDTYLIDELMMED
ncbi:ATP-binding protein, partial [Acinetobacter pittii]|uniref:AAA family ATPase n=1 Tax=Acinetobacter pittii TaxID=48296 RepID=UPI001EFD728A